MMTSIFITINLVIPNMWKPHLHRKPQSSPCCKKLIFQVMSCRWRQEKMETKATETERAGTTLAAECNYTDLEHSIHIAPTNLIFLRTSCEISGGSPLPFSHYEILHFPCPILLPPSLTKIFLGLLSLKKGEKHWGRKGEKAWPFGEREAEHEDRAERKASYVPAALLYFYIWVIPKKWIIKPS